MQIFNLTQHEATPDQTADGVVEPDAGTKERIKRLLTFQFLPSRSDLEARAALLRFLVQEHPECEAAMIGGAPYFMGTLERALKSANIKPLYSFSLRESVDEVQEDGSTVKRSVFRHAGWVEA